MCVIGVSFPDSTSQRFLATCLHGLQDSVFSFVLTHSEIQPGRPLFDKFTMFERKFCHRESVPCVRRSHWDRYLFELDSSPGSNRQRLTLRAHWNRPNESNVIWIIELSACESECFLLEKEAMGFIFWVRSSSGEAILLHPLARSTSWLRGSI